MTKCGSCICRVLQKMSSKQLRNKRTDRLLQVARLKGVYSQMPAHHHSLILALNLKAIAQSLLIIQTQHEHFPYLSRHRGMFAEEIEVPTHVHCGRTIPFPPTELHAWKVTGAEDVREM